MGFIRCQHSFKGPSGYGWTERFYLSTVNTLAAAIAVASPLRLARLQLLAPTIRDNGLVFHDESLPGSSAAFPPIPLPPGENAYNPAFSNDDPDFAWTDLQVGIDLANPLYRGRMFMGGLEDQLTFSDSPTIQAAEFVAAFRAWEAIAQNGQFATRVLNRDVNTRPLIAINGMSVIPPSTNWTWNVPNHGLNTGRVIKYYKVFGQSVLSPKQKNYSGTSTVTVIDANNFYVDRFYKSSQFTYIRGGSVRLVDYIVIPWTDVYQMRIMNKKRGVGRNPPRGRARTQGPRA